MFEIRYFLIAYAFIGRFNHRINQIELLTVDRDGMFQQVAVMGLSADKFSGCAAVAAGLGADGKRYLVRDGWTGLSGNNLATV